MAHSWSSRSYTVLGAHVGAAPAAGRPHVHRRRRHDAILPAIENFPESPKAITPGGSYTACPTREFWFRQMPGWHRTALSSRISPRIYDANPTPHCWYEVFLVKKQCAPPVDEWSAWTGPPHRLAGDDPRSAGLLYPQRGQCKGPATCGTTGWVEAGGGASLKAAPAPAAAIPCSPRLSLAAFRNSYYLATLLLP